MNNKMLKKVLLVDDDTVTLALCDMVIKRFPFAEQVDKAMNGKEALDYFGELVDNPSEAQKAPSLIFLDLNMPVMNGWDFLDEFVNKGFHTIFPDTRIIVLTSSIDPSDIQRADQYDIIIQFISKPLTFNIIKEIKQNDYLQEHFADN